MRWIAKSDVGALGDIDMPNASRLGRGRPADTADGPDASSPSRARRHRGEGPTAVRLGRAARREDARASQGARAAVVEQNARVVPLQGDAGILPHLSACGTAFPGRSPFPNPPALSGPPPGPRPLPPPPALNR